MKSRITKLFQHNDQPAVLLQESVFRLAGGGQPCDHGTIRAQGMEAKVVGVVKGPDGKVHVLELVQGEPQEGMDVQLELDEARRSSLTRMHTGEHILFQAITRVYPKLELEKIALDVDESSIFVLHPEVTHDKLLEAEKIAQGIIAEDRDITEEFVPKEEAQEYFDIRIKLDRIQDDEVRVIKVRDFDTSACSGTHCTKTGQVGFLFITGLHSVGKGRWQISFTVHAEHALAYGAEVKKASFLLGCTPTEVSNTVQRLLEERDMYKEQYRSFLKESLANLQPELMGDTQFYGTVLSGAETKVLVEASKSIMEKAKQEGKKTILLFITDKQVILHMTEDVPFEADKLVRDVLEPLGGRGGGKKHSAQGGFPKADPQAVLTVFKQKLFPR